MTEWDAAEYSRRSSLQEAMAQEVLALLDLKSSERILDVGCGDGKITAQIASRASKGSVVGVDPSRDMISFARRHFGPAMLPNLRFEVADARRLPFKNEFDLVVSFNALHWIPDQQTALSSIRSTLVLGGKAQLRLALSGIGISEIFEYVRRPSGDRGRFTASFCHSVPRDLAALASVSARPDPQPTGPAKARRKPAPASRRRASDRNGRCRREAAGERGAVQVGERHGDRNATP